MSEHEYPEPLRLYRSFADFDGTDLPLLAPQAVSINPTHVVSLRERRLTAAGAERYPTMITTIHEVLYVTVSLAIARQRLRTVR